MKKRNRVLGAVGGVVFGFFALTFLAAFFIYFGKELKFGINFIDAIKRLQILFDFQQTEIYVVTQFLTLGLFLVGAVWGLVWLILGAFKKHIIEILFFLGTCAVFFFFGLVALYHGEALLRNICEPVGGNIDGGIVGRLIVLPIVCVVILAGVIVTFAYDMKRIFAKNDPVIVVEPDEYTQETLFKEMFHVEKETNEDADEKLVKEVMAKVDERIREEELLATLPLSEEDIPDILREPAEEEIEHLPILDRVDEEVEEEPIEHLPILDKVDEEVKEEPIEHLPFLDKPMPEEAEKKEEPIEHLPFLDKPMPEEKKEEVTYEHLPILDKVEEEKKDEIPDFLKTESELAADKKSSNEDNVRVSNKKPTHHSALAFHISKTVKGYQVKAAGSKAVKGTYRSEEEAVKAIRKESPDASIRIHDKNGKIRSL